MASGCLSCSIGRSDERDLRVLDEVQYVRDSEAEYTLEHEAVSPSCDNTLKTLKIRTILSAALTLA